MVCDDNPPLPPLFGTNGFWSIPQIGKESDRLFMQLVRWVCRGWDTYVLPNVGLFRPGTFQGMGRSIGNYGLMAFL